MALVLDLTGSATAVGVIAGMAMMAGAVLMPGRLHGREQRQQVAT